MRVLGNVPIWGDPTEAETWIEVEDALRRQFRHPLGGVLNVDAAVIDSGKSTFLQHVVSCPDLEIIEGTAHQGPASRALQT
ncbi:terminase gpA endonuclease subunit [Yoonia maritima]|uniref:terminase gpA endonuclease subunit n=1 Tax=Yoonia maritima TaxID=1435347 RepID=UPI000D105948|nr:terminase gpA endonuclease subunit [Yoonia maritima]